jgi:hypothetical protein
MLESVFSVLDSRTLDCCLSEIAEMSHRAASFWTAAHGWASDEVAVLLSKAQLRLLSSMSRTLASRVKEIQQCPDEEGVLIIGWVHLRSLVEGSLKLFFTIYIGDYQSDPLFDRKNRPIPLADLRLQQMLTYSQQRKILEQHHELIHAARLRGNLIHAFATHGFDNRELGTAEEYLLSIRDFRDFLEDVLTYVPWPD